MHAEHTRQTETARDRTVIFLHIPKAAGTTLNQIIKRHYPAPYIHSIDPTRTVKSVEEFKQLPADEKQRFRIIIGHMSFGLHEHLPQPATYITILRDPVERIISLYYYILRNPGHYLHEKITSQKVSFEEFLVSGFSPEIDNGMTKAIAGHFTPFGGCTQNDFEHAKRNLTEHFSVVGLAERFDESLVFLKRTLGWKFPYYLHENVTPQRPAREKISPADLKTLEKLNDFDVKLYRVAAERFEEAVQSAGDPFQKELRQFQALSRPVSRLHSIVRKVKFAIKPPKL